MGSDKLANEGGEDFDDDMAASVEDLASRLQTHPSASSPTSTETGKNDMLVDDGFADVDFTLSDAPPVGFHPAKCQETTSPTPVASSDGQPPANVVGSLALSVPVSDESASRSTARSKDSSQLMTTQAPPAAGTATAAALPPTSAPGPHAHTQQPLPAVPSDVYRFDIAVQGGTNYAAHLSNNEIRTTNKQGVPDLRHHEATRALGHGTNPLIGDGDEALGTRDVA
ncbi:uncharacterized protein C8Q71DRAFT_721167 [Rhodofomes roseus]|uniref:Uncharacterized protein n=1 Tax=Rhodofomes roseus TaxID=34475 RepID=A0ABQ8KQN1_9APHY|nr:uncharacterized protein C8Q71DRAFT_721167 [Rhodofomes roseus]KAH9840659.1 hypothetical protein C8Q71DRAFT_721167 [Rhodofomes roseus]